MSIVENGVVFGGFFFWLKLPDNISADLVVRNTKLEENLLVTSGTMFEVSMDEDSARFTQIEPGKTRNALTKVFVDLGLSYVDWPKKTRLSERHFCGGYISKDFPK